MKRFNPTPYFTIFFLMLAFGAALLTVGANLAITQPLLYQLAYLLK